MDRARTSKVPAVAVRGGTVSPLAMTNNFVPISRPVDVPPAAVGHELVDYAAVAGVAWAASIPHAVLAFHGEVAALAAVVADALDSAVGPRSRDRGMEASVASALDELELYRSTKRRQEGHE